jgi:isopenicillin-N epimerase
MLPLDLDGLGAAYFTGNAHKWLCTPKGSAFLHVRRDRQQGMRPLVVSHGANSPRGDRSRFRLEFDWAGTGDPTPYLVIPTALEFVSRLLPGGWSAVQDANRNMAVAARRLLLDALGNELPLAPESMLGSLAAVELPAGVSPSAAEPDQTVPEGATYPPDPLHDVLWHGHRIEVPVYPWPHSPADGQPRRRLLRVSAQVYNSLDDYERLASVLRSLVP